MLKIISPTSKDIRQTDAWGNGWFRASRGTRSHVGADFICEPNQEIISPIAGKIIREARPYKNDIYSGLLISDGILLIKMFYFQPLKSILENNKSIKMGQNLGTAQDISKRISPKTEKTYTGMIPHIHVEIKINSAYLLPGMIENVYINPEILL